MLFIHYHMLCIRLSNCLDLGFGVTWTNLDSRIVMVRKKEHTCVNVVSNFAHNDRIVLSVSYPDWRRLEANNGAPVIGLHIRTLAVDSWRCFPTSVSVEDWGEINAQWDLTRKHHPETGECRRTPHTCAIKNTSDFRIFSTDAVGGLAEVSLLSCLVWLCCWRASCYMLRLKCARIVDVDSMVGYGGSTLCCVLHMYFTRSVEQSLESMYMIDSQEVVWFVDNMFWIHFG